MPGGKDKLRGNTPSLPAAASRFLIDAESGKKQSRGSEGSAQGAMPLPIPRQSIPAPYRAWYILPKVKEWSVYYESN